MYLLYQSGSQRFVHPFFFLSLSRVAYRQIVKWFWEVMGGFETEQLARVLQFVTGTSGVPSQGFAVLQVRPTAFIFCCSSGCVFGLPLPDFCMKYGWHVRLFLLYCWGGGALLRKLASQMRTLRCGIAVPGSWFLMRSRIAPVARRSTPLAESV